MLPLVKIMIYEMMHYNFEFNLHPGYASSDKDVLNAKDIQELNALISSLTTFKVKMAASFARVRIEKQAHGNNTREMLENIIPESKNLDVVDAGMY